VDARRQLLKEWASYIGRAAGQGALTGKPLPIELIEVIAGPRAGALEIYAGLQAGEILQALSKNDKANLRQFVPWNFVGEPACYMAGRFVRLEAGWPDHLARTMIRLSELGKNPKRGGWIAGQNERGQTVPPRLSDATPHFLVSGATGSGKSVALRNAVLQLSQDPLNRLVLADGKYGESLNQVAHLRGVVGPVASCGPSIRAALGWACQEMRRRYEQLAGSQPPKQEYQNGRVIVVFDEFQELIADPVIVALLRKLAAQGRGAHVHLLAATQHPTVAAFGDASTRRSLVGKLALRVEDPDASRVAVGGSLPRADYLLGAGDAYAVKPGAVHRIQGAFVDQRDFDKAEAGKWEFETWPEYRAEDVGRDLPQQRHKGRSFSSGEIGASLISAMEGDGRPALVNRLENENLGRPGSGRAEALLRLGRKTHAWLEGRGVELCYTEEGEWDGDDEDFDEAEDW
jgi:DNA segregation ATPase FtsK/SpoIIIE-like protein